MTRRVFSECEQAFSNQVGGAQFLELGRLTRAQRAELKSAGRPIPRRDDSATLRAIVLQLFHSPYMADEGIFPITLAELHGAALGGRLRLERLAGHLARLMSARPPHEAQWLVYDFEHGIAYLERLWCHRPRPGVRGLWWKGCRVGLASRMPDVDGALPRVYDSWFAQAALHYREGFAGWLDNLGRELSNQGKSTPKLTACSLYDIPRLSVLDLRDIIRHVRAEAAVLAADVARGLEAPGQGHRLELPPWPRRKQTAGPEESTTGEPERRLERLEDDLTPAQRRSLGRIRGAGGGGGGSTPPPALAAASR